jgi:UDP-N-acetylmuramyl pentapeptide phosphotransferase/UDP-N-acetylglucosamine-1-phosphate transferase
LPAFLSGLSEDLTKYIGVKARLACTAASAALFGYLFDAWVRSIGIPFIDIWLSIPLISIGFTIIAVCGLANAYNLIDGFNGLASMVSIITLLAISYVSFRIGDISLLIAALALIGANAGFFIWNYPKGFIFLGDGGAYLIGYWVAALSVLLVFRNPNVSPWFALLVNIYPIFETLFTMWRRRVHQGKSPGMPDGAHFHTLIYRRIVRWATALQGSSITNHGITANSKTSPYLWMLSSVGILPAVLWWGNTKVLQVCTLIFCLTYLWIYQAIVKFQTPKWLK